MPYKAVVALRMAAYYLVLLGVWQLVYSLEIWSPTLLPEPKNVWLAVTNYVDNGVLNHRRHLAGYGLVC